MKKLFRVFLSLAILYLVLSSVKGCTNKGHTIKYPIYRKQDDVMITESFVRRTKQELDHYYFKIKIGEHDFFYQTMSLSGNKKEVIDDILYLDDKEYLCILPIFKKDGIMSDVICKNKKQNIYYNYHDIQHPTSTMKTFVHSLLKSGYYERHYQDNKNKIEKIDMLTFYPNNTQDDFDFGITNYKGIYTIDDKVKNISLFDHDVYTRKLSAFVNGYYVVANYNEKYDFNSFYFVNLYDGTKYELELPLPIANDSYIAGVVNNKIYIIDKSNKRQYECSISKKTWKEVGNEIDGMRYYEDGEWKIVPSSRFTLKETTFKTNKEKKEEDYTLFLSTDGKKSGYHYYYKKMDKQYQIYRSNKQNSEVKTYLFTTDHIKTIEISKEYIFYQNGNEVHYYHDRTGNRTLLVDSELEFNKGILFGFYEK